MWTVPFKLKPGWDYEFWLSSGQCQSLRSAEGVPLKSIGGKFRTRS